jgi:hypothetical protein
VQAPSAEEIPRAYQERSSLLGWIATFPMLPDTRYLVQAASAAGNVVFATNGDRLYSTPDDDERCGS